MSNDADTMLRMHTDGRELRRFERQPVHAPYSQVEVQRRQPGRRKPVILTGHAYDISRGGMRFELDEPLAPGEQVTIHARLPGFMQPITATGRIVRLVDPEEVGPVRMAVAFEHPVDLDPHRAA
jgi:hypothetical protein